ncbi:C6 zinc finger domain protein [Penicillium brasilianum]|uniref:C6 zinc finger domain protein n=1 Tax=Penicillium brasilianum TaxID=104259 RepID=A0A1S9RXI8_PENBI|nr:C6 zinc finger domain protein [Penicillium brasilianum]
MNSASRNGRAMRSTLACLPCRSRHLKCDGERPCCARCAEFGKQCSYTQSRRGGLNRAALEERRKRLAATETTGADESSPQRRPELTTQFLAEAFSGYDLLNEINIGQGRLGMNSPVAGQIDVGDIEKDPLVDAYYENFHRLHPFLPPQRHFTRLCEDLRQQINFTPLIAVMRLIGHIYKSHEWSILLKDYVEKCFSQTRASDPIMVQCRLLYSMALFWYDYKAGAKAEIDQATRSATDMQMYLRSFSTTHGADDPVFQECWRRTWWMLYLVDGYFSGTLGTMNFTVASIDVTVDLPCEESEYESGNIPVPKTLQEFDCREFTQEIKFSSFAYLIGAVRCAAAAICAAPKIAKMEDSMHIIQTADSCLDGWRLLLPKNHKQVMSKTGEVDELMFQAHMIIHVATIGLHRPFSDLKFNIAEDISSCAREPPLDTSTPELVNMHTVRVLRSVEAQIRLLALPVRKFHHTPFTTCMVSEGTLALLSACNFLFSGRDLATARDQIRMTIGCLTTLGDIWPRTARNVREIQAIAQHVLGMRSNATSKSSTPSLEAVPLTYGDLNQRSHSSDGDFQSNDTETFPSIHSVEDLCGWYNFGDLAQLGDLDFSERKNW